MEDGDVITADKLNSSSVLIIEGDTVNGLSANGSTFKELWANKDKCYLILKLAGDEFIDFCPLVGINLSTNAFAFFSSLANYILSASGISLNFSDQIIDPGDSKTNNY